MKEKPVNIRKNRKCGVCGKIHGKGEKMKYWESKGPRYNEVNQQVGITYFKDWFCLDYKACCTRTF